MTINQKIIENINGLSLDNCRIQIGECEECRFHTKQNGKFNNIIGCAIQDYTGGGYCPSGTGLIFSKGSLLKTPESYIKRKNFPID